MSDRGASKIRLFWPPVVFVAFLLFAAIYLVATREPTYQGRAVTSWLKTSHLPAAQSGPYGRGVAYSNLVALRALGPKAVPYLVRALEKQDSTIVKAYARFCYKSSPQFRRYLPEPPLPAYHWRFNAAVALGQMGADAQPAIPALVRALKTSDWMSQVTILTSLNSLHADSSDLRITLRELAAKSTNRQQHINLLESRRFKPQIALPILIPALTDPNPEIRATAVRAIEGLGSPAEEAVPALIASTQDKDREVRYLAVRTLRVVGPAATSAIPALQKAFVDESFLVRSAATNTLNQLGQR